MFEDKYTQVPRILGPIVRTIERIDLLANNSHTKELISLAGGVPHVRRLILRDFFRSGFDGSGSDGGTTKMI